MKKHGLKQRMGENQYIDCLNDGTPVLSFYEALQRLYCNILAKGRVGQEEKTILWDAGSYDISSEVSNEKFEEIKSILKKGNEILKDSEDIQKTYETALQELEQATEDLQNPVPAPSLSKSLSSLNSNRISERRTLKRPSKRPKPTLSPVTSFKWSSPKGFQAKLPVMTFPSTEI